MESETPALTTRQRNAKARSDENLEAFRKRYYELAGIDEAEMARSLRKAFNTTNQQLDAEKVELVTHQGDYQRVSVPDNPSRLRAAEQVYDLTGVRVSKQERSGGGSVTVVVNLPAHHLPAQTVTIEAVSGKDDYENSSEKNNDNL